jgi:hypothetical protein
MIEAIKWLAVRPCGMPSGNVMESLSDSTDTIWPFPFTPQDWLQTLAGCASLCARPARRGQAAARLCGDPGGSASAEFHDLFPSTVLGFAVQEASPAHHCCHTPQSGRKTGPSGPSPGALTTDDRARDTTRAVCVWEHDVDPGQAILHASGTGIAAHRDRHDALGIAPRLARGGQKCSKPQPRRHF